MIKVVGELIWFLGLYVIRNRTKRTIWLSQKAYIMKICNEFPMEILELFLIDKDEIP